MPQILYSFSEFKERQQITDPNDCLWVNNRWLFVNGAQSDGQNFHQEPPPYEEQLLPLLFEFQRHKLGMAERKFNETMSYIHEQANIQATGAGGGPDPAAFEELKMFKKIAAECREAIAQLEADRKTMVGPSRDEMYFERRAQQKAAAQAAIARAQAITL